jgi:D-alanyl-D-alanine carboxypeptidase
LDSKFWSDYENGWLLINRHYLHSKGMGGILTNANSVGAFLKDLLRTNPKLLGKTGKKKLFEVQKDLDGDDLPMTLGWHVGSHDKLGDFFIKKAVELAFIPK